MAKITVVRLSDCSIFQQLQIEEALLRTSQDNWCLLNEGSPPAIVLGISSKVQELINPAKMQTKPVPLIRRFSGGGTVFVDESSYFVSLICNTACSNVKPTPKEILCWNAQLYSTELSQHGFCVQENDYALGDKKFAGNAQYLIRGRWLHHTSLLWDYDPQNMEYLLLPPKMPSYRLQRSHTDFLCRLKDYLSTKEQLSKTVVASLKTRFDVEEIRATAEYFKEILSRPHRKATIQIKNC